MALYVCFHVDCDQNLLFVTEVWSCLYVHFVYIMDLRIRLCFFNQHINFLERCYFVLVTLCGPSVRSAERSHIGNGSSYTL